MRRIAAAWRLRTEEHDHLASMGLIGALIALTLAGAAWGGSTGNWVAGALVSVGWAGVYVWGLWDEGGRLAGRRDYRARRGR